VKFLVTLLLGEVVLDLDTQLALILRAFQASLTT